MSMRVGRYWKPMELQIWAMFTGANINHYIFGRPNLGPSHTSFGSDLDQTRDLRLSWNSSLGAVSLISIPPRGCYSSMNAYFLTHQPDYVPEERSWSSITDFCRVLCSWCGAKGSWIDRYNSSRFWSHTHFPAHNQFRRQVGWWS